MHNAIKTLRTKHHFFCNRQRNSFNRPSQVPGKEKGKRPLLHTWGLRWRRPAKKTVIINTDCYRPMLSRRFGKYGTNSWLDLLYGKATLEESLTPLGQKGLYLLDCEPDIAAPVELIGSNKFLEMVRINQKQF